MARLSAAVLLLASLISFAAMAQAPVFRGGAQTVAVYATVRDAAGRLVPGLTRADFQILDDGRPAVITTFSNDVLPAGIALMLDMSTSMLGEHVRVRDAALSFVDALLPADRVRIGTFGEEIALSPWLTSDKRILGRVLREEVWPGGDTPLWAAMHAGMSSLAGDPERHVVVTLTDGVDTGCPALLGAAAPAGGRAVVARASFAARAAPRASSAAVRPQIAAASAISCPDFQAVETLALREEFMVYAIGMEGPGLTGGLIKLADETGGGRFELKRNADLAPAFHEVADELHHQYALGFTPVALDGRTHVLDVRLTRAGLTARARKTYLATAR
jgi:VWFA-related protein